MSKKSIVDKPITCTVAGITLKVDPNFADDFELIADLSSGDDSRAVKGFSAMFDAICKTKKKDVLEALRNESGRVPFEQVIKFVQDVSQQVNALKNS
jgi:hypothetical protein